MYRSHSGVCFTCVGNTTWEATEKHAVQELNRGIMRNSSLTTTQLTMKARLETRLMTLILLIGPVKPVATLVR